MNKKKISELKLKLDLGEKTDYSKVQKREQIYFSYGLLIQKIVEWGKKEITYVQ